MDVIRTVISGYRKIEPHIFYMVLIQFSTQAVNTSFFLLLNYYMVEEGYVDHEVADVISYRFLAVCLLAFPLGLFIKGRLLRPFFFLAALLVPILSHLMLYAIDQHWGMGLYVVAMLWGIGFTSIQVSALPYILMNAKPETHSEAISFSYLSFPAMICLSGLFIYMLKWINPIFFTDKTILQITASISFLGLYFFSRIKPKEKKSNKIPFSQVFRGYDWGIIAQAVIPTFIISIGAGFTIPVINLFFLNVHGVSSKVFSILGASTFLLVACTMVFMPYIRKNFGYRIAITLFQSLAVLALLIMATTEYYSDWFLAPYIAMIFYVVRQPLMSAARPMTSELMMYYVGKRNQELIAALSASIWSGSWFVSMRIFGWMRQNNFRYVEIFLITVALYAVGVSWYAYLIYRYRIKSGQTGKETPIEEVEKSENGKASVIKQKNKVS